MDLNSRLTIPSDLVWRKMDDNTVVVSPKTGKVRVLNGIGSLIWEALTAGESISDIQASIIAQYNIMPEQANRDIQTFLADLQKRGLVK